MSRSVTTCQLRPASLPRRAATVVAVPTLHHVEKELSCLELSKRQPRNEVALSETSECPKYENDRVITGCTDLHACAEAEECTSKTEEVPVKRESSPIINISILESVSASPTESEKSVEFKRCEKSHDTSAGDLSSHEFVHKPLKDLIFKTNKEIYDVDSNRVKYRVGLSKRVPSLHPKRRGNVASSSI